MTCNHAPGTSLAGARSHRSRQFRIGPIAPGSTRHACGQSGFKVLDDRSARILDAGSSRIRRSKILLPDNRQPVLSISIGPTGLPTDNHCIVVDVVVDDVHRVAGMHDRVTTVSPRRPPDVTATKMETYECRRPEREADPGNPSPPGVRSVIYPPTVMVGQPAPGFIADPGPTPTRVASPTPRSVRNPSDRHMRKPDIAIRTHTVPIAVAIQIVNTVNIGSTYSGDRGTANVTRISAVTPQVKTVFEVQDRNVLQIGLRARDDQLFVSLHIPIVSAIRYLRFSFSNCNQHLSGRVH